MSDPTEYEVGPGTVLAGRYEVKRLLGEGGVGAVFEAVHATSRKRVAVKVLHPALGHSLAAVRRFQREARATMTLVHPNVVQIFEVGRDAHTGAHFLAQEFLDGLDLRHLLAQRVKLPVGEAVALIVPVMSALAAAHEHGIIHRDVKPENVFLVRPGGKGPVVPKVIDFGLSKVTRSGVASTESLTRAGTVLGTPQYMSPEQAGGDDDLDARTDVWSVGVVLYEMLCGRCPIESGTPVQIITRILTDPPQRVETFAPWVPRPLADALHRALEPTREDRLPDMRAFAAHVAPYARMRTREPLPTRPPPPPAKAPSARGMPAVRHGATRDGKSLGGPTRRPSRGVRLPSTVPAMPAVNPLRSTPAAGHTPRGSVEIVYEGTASVEIQHSTLPDDGPTRGGGAGRAKRRSSAK